MHGWSLKPELGGQCGRILHHMVHYPPYGGFANPIFKLIENDTTITDIEIEYPEDYTKQMLNYSENYSFL